MSNYITWSHVDTVHEDDLDTAMDVLHNICDNYHLDVVVVDNEDGTYDISINGPRSIINDAIEEYFNHT